REAAVGEERAQKIDTLEGVVAAFLGDFRIPKAHLRGPHQDPAVSRDPDILDHFSEEPEPADDRFHDQLYDVPRHQPGARPRESGREASSSVVVSPWKFYSITPRTISTLWVNGPPKVGADKGEG